MKVTKKITILLLTTTLISAFKVQQAVSIEPPSIEWNKTYGGTDEDGAYSVQQTNDGGYIVAGYTRSFDAEGYADGWLVKTDASGNSQWDTTYGGVYEDKFYSVAQTSDGGYIVAGHIAYARA